MLTTANLSLSDIYQLHLFRSLSTDQHEPLNSYLFEYHRNRIVNRIYPTSWYPFVFRFRIMHWGRVICLLSRTSVATTDLLTLGCEDLHRGSFQVCVVRME